MSLNTRDHFGPPGISLYVDVVEAMQSRNVAKVSGFRVLLRDLALGKGIDPGELLDTFDKVTVTLNDEQKGG